MFVRRPQALPLPTLGSSTDDQPRVGLPCCRKLPDDIGTEEAYFLALVPSHVRKVKVRLLHRDGQVKPPQHGP